MRFHYGSMIIHSRDLRDIGSAYPLGVELSVVKQSLGSRAWASCNCYPRKGFMLGFWNFGKPDVLGNGFSANFFLEPVFGAWNRIFITTKAVIGVAFLTKPFDLVKNPYNLSYSTKISFPLHLGATLNYRFNKSFNIGIGLIYNHISNGGLKEPNKGINWPTISLGIDFKPVEFLPDLRKPTAYRSEEGNKINGFFTVFVTAKQLNHSELKKYIIAGSSFEGNYRISRLSSITAGIDAEWDETDREEIRRNDSVKVDHKKGGIYLGHQFMLGKFTFSQSLGVYIYSPYNPNDPVYQHYTLLYKPGRKVLLGIRLKAHRHVADYLALEVGYKIF